MSKSPRKFSKFFKFNCVLESFVGGNASAVASRHGIHISQLNSWRRILKSSGPDVFESGRKRMSDEERKLEQLERIIGRLTVENSILKKTYKMLA